MATATHNNRIFAPPSTLLSSFVKENYWGQASQRKGEKKVDTAYRKNFYLTFPFVPVYFLPSDCSIDTVPRSLGPTGLDKTSITYFKQFFTVRLSHCIWMCHALCKPVLILCIHAILFTLLFLPCVNEILILCFAGFISTSQLPHVSELKLDAAAMFFGSCFVGKAFRGNICDHGCIKCQA